MTSPTKSKFSAEEEAMEAAIIAKMTSGLDEGFNAMLANDHSHEEEKAEDAVDYEDFDDLDDLPDEEPAEGETKPKVEQMEDDEDNFMKGLEEENAAGLQDADGDDDMVDELFGEHDDMDIPAHRGSDDVRMGSSPAPHDDGDGQPDTYDQDAEAELDDQVQIKQEPMDLHQFPPVREKTREQILAEIYKHFPYINLSQAQPIRMVRLNYRKVATYVPKLHREPKRLVPTKQALEIEPDAVKLFRANNNTNTIQSALTAAHNNDSRRVVLVEHIDNTVSDSNQQVGEGEGEEAESWWCDLGKSTGTRVDTDDSKTSKQKDESVRVKFERDLEIISEDWDKMVALADEKKKRNKDNSTSGPLAKRPKLLPRYIDDLPNSWPYTLEDIDPSMIARVTLDLNDPKLLIEKLDGNEIRKSVRIGREFRGLNSKAKQDLMFQRYNISNDEAYDALKENHQNKVRSTLSEMEIVHALPALRLQTPYYKTRLSIRDARNFHRPALQFYTEIPFRFSRMKWRKKKSYRGMDPQQVLQKTADLSLSDNTPFILFEYSEEHPIVMANFGMGGRIINYYRRKGATDEYRPKAELGEAYVLMPQDRSPFWNFGTVDPGETVPALCNRMTRAPIFKQNPKSTDFLVIRTRTNADGEHYYLRTIPHIFTVGQVFPVMDVPGPHSRKVTNANRNRLKMVCYRVLKRKPEKAITVKDIAGHFPENTEMQSRQKMKEFMSYHKEKQLWEMRPGESLPDEAALRALVTPETVCLLDAMQVGVRYLEDSGYNKDVHGHGRDDSDDEKEEESFEQMMAPWVITRNFLEATQGKAMLKLYGEGDPTGRGEAFSFIRTSMKGGFKAVGEAIDEKMDKAKLKELGGHSYNVAKQQKSYEESIQKIWNNQKTSLQNTEEITEEQMLDAQRDDEMSGTAFDRGKTPRSEAVTPSPWGRGGGGFGDDDNASQFSASQFGPSSKNFGKVLKITRRVRDPATGQIKTKIQFVEDAHVIRLYKQERKRIVSKKFASNEYEDIAPTGDHSVDEENKKAMEAELARLLNNRERRLVRENQRKKKNGMDDQGSPDGVMMGADSPGGSQMGTPGGYPMTPSEGGGKKGKGKATTSRKCTSCGMVGHIKTNKKLCPNANPELAKQMGWTGSVQDGMGDSFGQ